MWYLSHKSIYRCAATNCLNHNLWLRVYDGLHIIYFLILQFLCDRVCKYNMQSRWDYYDMQLIADGCKIIVAWTCSLSQYQLCLYALHRFHFLAATYDHLFCVLFRILLQSVDSVRLYIYCRIKAIKNI